MAGFGWSLRHGNTLGSKRLLLPSQIACRICDHVFTSVQALIDHIESHMVEDVETARWKNGLSFSSSRADPLANPFSFGPSTPSRSPQTGFLGHSRYNFLSSTERNPAFSPSTPQNIASAQPIIRAPQSQRSSLARNKYTVGRSQHVPFALPTQPKLVMEEPHSSIDRTRPFLRQLERPFSSGGNHGKRSYAETLDLTLKL